METKMDAKLEAQIEKLINDVTSSDLFLRSVSTLINFNSYRKIWTQKAIEKILKELELPVRRDQEKLLALVQELEIRIKKLQLNEDIRLQQSEEIRLQRNEGIRTQEKPAKRNPVARPVIVAKTTKTKKAPTKRIN